MEERKKPTYLTPAQKIEIVNSNLKNCELVKLYNSNPKTISQIRIRAKKNLGITGQIGGGNNRKITEEQIDQVLNDKKTPSKQLAEKFNVHYKTIYDYRKKHGIVLEKKEKIIFEKEKKPIVIKKLVKKEKQPLKKRTVNEKKTFLEEENIRREKAIEISKKFETSDADK